jgi:hypothetical protein
MATLTVNFWDAGMDTAVGELAAARKRQKRILTLICKSESGCFLTREVYLPI